MVDVDSVGVNEHAYGAVGETIPLTRSFGPFRRPRCRRKLDVTVWEKQESHFSQLSTKR